jgi:outer membrane receptor for ferrienterochelin and colicin
MNGQIFGQVAGFVAISVLGLACAGEAFAQLDTKGDQLEEITVAAQKRVSTVQDTPISITALTGQDLEDRGITDLAAIVQFVPGVSMRTSGPGQTELEMRGMTSSGGNSSTVGFYE